MILYLVVLHLQKLMNTCFIKGYYVIIYIACYECKNKIIYNILLYIMNDAKCFGLQKSSPLKSGLSTRNFDLCVAMHLKHWGGDEDLMVEVF